MDWLTVVNLPLIFGYIRWGHVDCTQDTPIRYEPRGRANG
jgi:hypothetical protein